MEVQEISKMMEREAQDNREEQPSEKSFHMKGVMDDCVKGNKW